MSVIKVMYGKLCHAEGAGRGVMVKWLMLPAYRGTRIVSSPLTHKIQYCGEPPSSRGSVFDLRPPGSEF